MRTPCQPSSPARVTTNDGIFSRVMIVPWNAPMRAQASQADDERRPTRASSAVRLIRAMAMAAPTAPTKPTERSISLRMRAYSSAMPSKMMKVACTNRLTMLVGRQEGARLHAEEDADDDQADDDGERTAFAAADPLPPGPQVIAEGVGQDVRCQDDAARREPWRFQACRRRGPPRIRLRRRSCRSRVPHPAAAARVRLARRHVVDHDLACRSPSAGPDATIRPR